MKHNVEFKNFEPEERIRKLIAQLINKLQKRAKRFPPDERYAITGQMRRSAFGMTADQTMVSDAVHLKIRIRLTVGIDPKIG